MIVQYTSMNRMKKLRKYQQFYDELNSWFKNQNLWKTKKDFAKSIDIPYSQMKHYFRGGAFPKKKVAKKIYAATNISCLDVFADKPSMSIFNKFDDKKQISEDTPTQKSPQSLNKEKSMQEKIIPEKPIKLAVSGDVSQSKLKKDIKKSNEFSRIEERQEFFMPISGFIWLYPEEVEVVNHPIFQRLGYVYQLGQTCLVYRGATHKRLEHVLGTVHMVHRMISAVAYTRKKSIRKKEKTAAPIETKEDRFIRLGALLHDIGHLAAGHTIEDELCLIGKHDHDERLDLVLNNTESRWLDSQGRTLEG